jgi:hypothetical protein
MSEEPNSILCQLQHPSVKKFVFEKLFDPVITEIKERYSNHLIVIKSFAFLILFLLLVIIYLLIKKNSINVQNILPTEKII